MISVKNSAKYRAQISSGLGRNVPEDEIFGVTVNTGKWTDFDGRVVLAELVVEYKRPEYETSKTHFSLEESCYAIYPNGIGIFRSLLYVSLIPGIEHFSVLKQRFMNAGDYPALEMIAQYLIPR